MAVFAYPSIPSLPIYRPLKVEVCVPPDWILFFSVCWVNALSHLSREFMQSGFVLLLWRASHYRRKKKIHACCLTCCFSRITEVVSWIRQAIQVLRIAFFFHIAFNNNAKILPRKDKDLRIRRWEVDSWTCRCLDTFSVTLLRTSISQWRALATSSNTSKR